MPEKSSPIADLDECCHHFSGLELCGTNKRIYFLFNNNDENFEIQ